MSDMFVVYHKETTRYLCNHKGVKTDKERFVTQAAAKAALTREVKRGAVKAEDFLVANAVIFHDRIEKSETGVSAQDGKTPVTVKANTPYCCDPRFERYWSM